MQPTVARERVVVKRRRRVGLTCDGILDSFSKRTAATSTVTTASDVHLSTILQTIADDDVKQILGVRVADERVRDSQCAATPR